MAKHTCAHCRSSVESTDGVTECPHCTRALRGPEGALLRPLDIDFDAKLEKLDTQAKANLKQGTIVVTVMSVISLVPVPILPAIVGFVVIVYQLIWARWKMASPYARQFTGARRIVTRWLSRVVVLSLTSLHTSHAIPVLGHVLGPLVSPLLFAAICAAVWGYFRFHLIREQQRIPITTAEKLLLALAFALVFMLIGAFILLAVLFGSLFGGPEAG